MSTRSQREFLKVQLLETKRLLELVGDHPVMSVAYAEREAELEEQIAALPLGSREARTVLLFSGEPVQGSQGIDASFAGRVLEPFQSMVMADYADRWHGTVGSRGRRIGEGELRLLLTALPRGSFGRFDFLDEEGHKISGRIDDSLTPDEVATLSREHFNRECVATLIKTTILFKNGRVRTACVLKGLKSVEDGATVPLFYENRTPELNIINPELNEEIYQTIEAAGLDDEQEEKLEKVLGQRYHLITRDDRLNAVAKDIVHHFLNRGYQGKAMVVSIDKLTALKMYAKVRQEWEAEQARVLADEYNSGALSIGQFFAQLVTFTKQLNEEEKRHLREQLSEEELAVFDILTRPGPELSPNEIESIKLICKNLLAKLKTEKLVLAWRTKRTTRAAVRVEIEKMLDSGLPGKYTAELFEQKCGVLFQHVLEKYPDQGASVYAIVG